MKDKKQRKISFNLAGGNASKNSISYKLSMPTEFIKAIGIDENNKMVDIEIDGDRIIITKSNDQ